VLVGSVKVPVFEIVEIIGAVRVLFVSVSLVLRATSVSVLVGNVSVPVFVIVEIIGAVRVLFVRVSVVARPTSVSVEVGRVKVPVFEIVEMTGAVKVLLVRVCVPAIVANVPAPDGIVIAPPLFIDDIVGVVRVLLVSVSVDVLDTRTSVRSGRVSDRFAVCDETKVVVVAVVAPPSSTPNRLVASPLSTNKQDASTNDLFVNESVVALPTNVSVEVGRVRVPVFEIVEIMGVVRVLFVSVSVDVLETSVSVKSGNVKDRFAVCENTSVVVVAVVAPAS
jgi:flagellar motor switch/type III secretory pathway protein FliN